MPEDSQTFLTEWKGKPVDGECSTSGKQLFADWSPAIVEQVRDGSNLRVRLLLPNGDHQFANITMAGVRCPRSSSKQGEASEQWGEEVCPVTRLPD